MEQKLKLAGIAGIVYLISSLPELILEIVHEYSSYDQATTGLLFVAYAISMVSTIIFFYGFILIGSELQNTMLVVAALIIIFTTIFYYVYEWYTIDLMVDEEEVDLFSVSVLLLFGFSGIFFGAGLHATREVLGQYASIAGMLEIITGIFFITIILFFIGLIVNIPAIIFEILLLFKAAKLPQFQSAPRKNSVG